MIRCIAIDDEPLALELITAFCEVIDYIDLQKTFTNAKDASAYLMEHPVNLLFLDIQMPDISGIDFFKNLEDKCMVIFTTAYSQYAVEGFELNAVDYLLKPFEFDRFLKATNKAKEFYEYSKKERNETSYIFVRSDYSLVKIDSNEILYVESIDDYIKIHLAGKKPVMTLSTLKAIEDKLPASNFIRVHRSFIVALNKIDSVRGKTIQLGASEIPVSNKYEADFFREYTRELY